MIEYCRLPCDWFASIIMLSVNLNAGLIKIKQPTIIAIVVEVNTYTVFNIV